MNRRYEGLSQVYDILLRLRIAGQSLQLSHAMTGRTL